VSKILLVDDEINPGAKGPDMDYMWHYAKALEEKGHDVTSVNRVDDALKQLQAKGAYFDLAVLDIMMPPGRALRNEAHLNGMRTGIHLALRIIREFPRLPIVILTNSRDAEIQKVLGEKENVRLILLKDDISPFDFIEAVEPFLSESHP
jgi:CheY-like chemotaxis protein